MRDILRQILVLLSTIGVIVVNGLASTVRLNGRTTGDISDNFDVYYYIDWDDGNLEKWIGPYNSDEAVTLGHIWYESKSYTIRAKAKDMNDSESEWETFDIKIEKSRTSPCIFFQRILENFQDIFKILRYIL